MSIFTILNRTTGCLLAFAAASVGVFGIDPAAAAQSRAHNDIQIVLEPESSRLEASVKTHIRPGADGKIAFFLSPAARDLSVTVDGQAIEYTFRNRTLLIDIGKPNNNRPVDLTIEYTCRFSDPVPHMPANTDNPGYGVTATIGPQGTLLLAGSGWYPEPLVDQTTYRLRVDAPAGILAVTAGRLVGHSTEKGRTRSEWRIDQPVRGLALSAARYVVQTRQVGDITAATYFFEDSQHLVKTYLDAVERYLILYQELFGPYAFDKFAVVENFFPTGYGFPSYTLLGRTVLRLPFIPYTSLGHEIAHCWWGNGVYSDFRQGNWSEGITTYVADYLFKEQRSAADALAYRQQWLRNYSALVDDASDFPLSRFSSRIDPVTKTIGYDKAAMVFHMVRRQIGDDAFWETLKEVYRRNLFQTISWDDWRRAFEEQSGVPLKRFFTQWIEAAGAPQPALHDVTIERDNDGYIVTGSVIQPKPYFDFEADLSLETRDAKTVFKLDISGRQTPFRFSIPEPPRRLVFDPEVHLMRRLHADEIPPTVNSIKGAEQVTIVLADHLDNRSRRTAELLSRALGLQRVQFMNENDVDLKTDAGQDLILFGRPSRSDLLSLIGTNTGSAIQQTILQADRNANPNDAYFGVFPQNQSDKRVVALFWPADSTYSEPVARKVTHYGKYSYLIFRQGRNIEKGTWPIMQSPLIYTWR